MEILSGDFKLQEIVDNLCNEADPYSENKLTEKLGSYLKVIYQNSVDTSSARFGELDSLIVDGLDPDSVWEELRSHNQPLLDFVLEKASALEDRIVLGDEKLDCDDDTGGDVADEEYGSLNYQDHEQDEFGENEDDADENIGDYEFDYADGEEVESESEADSARVADIGISAPTLVNRPLTDEEEDAMEETLDELERQEDQRAEKVARRAGQKGILEYEEDDEEDDMDFVQRVLYKAEEDDDDEEDMEDGPGGDNIMYDDFFGDRSSNNKSLKKEQLKKRGNKNHNDELAYAEDNDEYDENDINIDDDEFDEGLDEGDEDQKDSVSNKDNNKSDKEPERLTAYERRRRVQQKEISEMESELVGRKSWELRGEVKAGDRPENSLLEISADVERASKPAPLVTEVYTNTLEEMIIQRVRESKYDDVCPREGKQSDELHNDEVDEPALSQEKSKIGLGEVYADEYLARLGVSTGKAAAANEAEEQLRRTVRGLFNQICRDLDGLSHFYFTPKPIPLDTSITAAPAAPAVLLEDIAPYASHSGTALASTAAPEEVYEKKRGREGALAAVSEKELTQEDRKRLRRARKEVRRKQESTELAKEQIAAKSDPGSAAGKRAESRRIDDILRQDRRVVTQVSSDSRDKRGGISNSGGNFSKSSFFSNLQEQVQQEVRTGRDKAPKRQVASNTTATSSSIYKL